jgi:hypothetical protein
MQPTIRILGFFQKPSIRGGETVLHDWVRYAPIHAIQTVVNEERIDRLKPNDKLAMSDDAGIRSAFIKTRWAEIEPAYEAWKQGNEIPANGTPLGVWPGITPEQAGALKLSGIRTVEEIATLPDHLLGKIHLPNMREMRVQAKAYLDARGTQVIADQMARRDEEVAALREQLDEALGLLNSLTTPAEAPKAKRKPKAVEADTEPDDIEEAA